ncbi:thiol methyltransferase [Fusarium austroafricanum]|uniref:Thiol methyltransferase n=1 Tax=Fusarium austroafricanum TaxID=2364996 RepID=A0A8H4KEJ6_9HYPO|nr:thiol methyltransferase [Fusarium austroafricanum]
MDAPSSATSNSSAQQSPSVQMAPQPAPAQSNGPSTGPFLQDFTLIAEAAKRAQMAIMIRDFEECGL